MSVAALADWVLRRDIDLTACPAGWEAQWSVCDLRTGEVTATARRYGKASEVAADWPGFGPIRLLPETLREVER